MSDPVLERASILARGLRENASAHAGAGAYGWKFTYSCRGRLHVFSATMHDDGDTSEGWGVFARLLLELGAPGEAMDQLRRGVEKNETAFTFIWMREPA